MKPYPQGTAASQPHIRNLDLRKPSPLKAVVISPKTKANLTSTVKMPTAKLWAPGAPDIPIVRGGAEADVRTVAGAVAAVAGTAVAAEGVVRAAAGIAVRAAAEIAATAKLASTVIGKSGRSGPLFFCLRAEIH